MGEKDRQFWYNNAVKVNIEKRMDFIAAVNTATAGTKESAKSYDELYWNYRYNKDKLAEIEEKSKYKGE